MRNYGKLFFAAFLFAGVLLSNCKKENKPLPKNPYDDVVYEDSVTNPVFLQRNSIADLQKRIFSVKCANPGCHDGNFEPDFRTIHSSYNTLVYHPVIKNNVAQSFKYRVVPSDTAQSVLYERITNCCFVNTNDRMPQDNIGEPLPAQDIADIGDWIMKGAKDMFGNAPQLPNTKPKVINYVAFKNDYTVFYSVDTTYREGGVFYNPFSMPNNTEVAIALFVTDDSTAVKDLKINQLKFSTNPDNFANPVATMNCFYLDTGNDEVWITTFNTNSLPTNQQLFMRYYVHDGNPQNLTEFPDDKLPIFYKTYASFKILP